MRALIGFVAGYVAGSSMGPEGYERLRTAWRHVAESEEVQGLVATATGVVENAVARGGAAVGSYLEAASARDGQPGSTLRRLAGTGDLTRAMRAITESPAIHELWAGGAALLGGMLERGKARFERGGFDERG